VPWRHLVKAGYWRVSEWMYTVPDNNMNNGEGFTYLGKSLGFPKNDGDNLWAGLTLVGSNYWAGTMAVSYSRDGQKTVTSRWLDSEGPDSLQGLPFDYTTRQFPSGIIERTVSWSLEGLFHFKDYADARIAIENRWVENPEHRQSNGYSYDPRFFAQLSLHWSAFYRTLPQ